ncbi:hypothetical protein Lsai_3440 [Legionella sainthelensi]|uniref:Uncharacterized protein n=1 Tax=Legionella sainthelensi TaxID=28087 RepID=A0A0W0YCE4_9GAMM|nr:hypothetical protein [Legionella sainthelensi]KTD54618.1 hypothetical protein Lsai_3440 [Legionella sainthelensi]VEH30246.1 Uncharacterised protein [Legionella sainthelensi]
MFFKREKNPNVPVAVILEKYDTNPVNHNVASSYDNELHTPKVLTKYLNQEIKFLESILEANKGLLTEESTLSKEVAASLRFAEYDLERVTNNFNAVQTKFKKAKKDENLKSEQNATKIALTKCQNRLKIMEKLNHILHEIKEDQLDKNICAQLKSNIKTLKNIIDEISHLTKKANVIYQKYSDLWGENEEQIEKKLESSKQSIEKKDIKKFEVIISTLEGLYHKLPQQYQFLDEFLDSVSSVSAQIRPN